jgi:hypothetical protein
VLGGRGMRESAQAEGAEGNDMAAGDDRRQPRTVRRPRAEAQAVASTAASA